MEEQKFEALAMKARKRWARAQKLTVVYTIVALLGGSLWLAIAYYQARRLKKGLEAKIQELDRRQTEIDAANSELTKKLIALEIERKNNEKAREALQEIRKGTSEAKVIAENALKVMGKEQLKATPTPEASVTPTPQNIMRSAVTFNVRPGSYVKIYILARGGPNLLAVAKDGQELAPSSSSTSTGGKWYQFVVDKRPGETISLLVEFGFLPSAPEDADYVMQLQINGATVALTNNKVAYIAKSDPILTRAYRFQVQ